MRTDTSGRLSHFTVNFSGYPRARARKTAYCRRVYIHKADCPNMYTWRTSLRPKEEKLRESFLIAVLPHRPFAATLSETFTRLLISIERRNICVFYFLFLYAYFIAIDRLASRTKTFAHH